MENDFLLETVLTLTSEHTKQALKPRKSLGIVSRDIFFINGGILQDFCSIRLVLYKCCKQRVITLKYS